MFLIFKWKNWYIYKGEWKDIKANGHWVIKYNEGEFKNGDKYGHGKFKMKDGNAFEG